MAKRHPAACRVSVRKGRSGWCGSGTLCGYDTFEGQAGAWVLTNAHVLPTVGQKAVFRFHMPDGTDKNFDGVAEYVAYSERYQIDWAFAFIPGLNADSGIEPIKLSKSRPQGRAFQQTGAPRCVWPLKSVDFTLRDLIQSQKVYRLTPNSIGGQSGSGLRSNANRGVVELLLTWTWGGYCACQASYHIWISKQTKSSEVGFLRVPGLIEVSEGELPIEDRGIVPGYQEGPQEMDSVQELPVWDGDIDPGDDPDDPTEPDPGQQSKGVPVDLMIDFAKAQIELNQEFLKALEQLPAEGEKEVDPSDPCEDDPPTFGL